MLMTMLRSLREVFGYSVCTMDAYIGSIRELYLDDKEWVIRGFLVKVEGATGDDQVYVPSCFLEETDPGQRIFLIQSCIRELKKDVPVSLIAGEYPSLRPVHRIIGSKVYAKDSEVGRVEDLILNDADFAVRYLVINAEVVDKKFMISPWWCERVFWETGGIFLRFGVEEVLQSPEYDFRIPVMQDYESKLHEYYRKRSYWA